MYLKTKHYNKVTWGGTLVTSALTEDMQPEHDSVEEPFTKRSINIAHRYNKDLSFFLYN